MAHRYLTTTLPYVNSDPHLGHALEFVQADALARYWRAQGHEVFLNVGTDEHGQKIYRKALEAGEDPQVYVDRYAARFKALCELLSISATRFIRTTDPDHIAAAQRFWERCAAAGDIYKATYRVRYCVGCEMEKTDSELEDGRCPLHPSLQLEEREEENYFFRFSRYQHTLLQLYNTMPTFVVPEERLHEVRAFVEGGLRDFSISRLRSKMPWGVPVPGDESQVMYVWFDALVNYLSTIGWPDDPSWEQWWPGVQVAGKDNLRQQAAMWQAMLFSAGLPPSRQILIHGFITSGGHKMSKTLGNVIDPVAIAQHYGADALRFVLLAKVHPFRDSDLTLEEIHTVYTAELVNGIGNVVARVTALAERHLPTWRPPTKDAPPAPQEFVDAMERYHFHEALGALWRILNDIDHDIAHRRTYALLRERPADGAQILARYLTQLWEVGWWLEPFLPLTARKVREALMPPRKPEPLFPRREPYGV